MVAILREPELLTLEVLSSLSYRTGELSQYLHEVAQAVSTLIQIDWAVVTLCYDGLETVLASSLDMGEGNHTYSLHGAVTNTVVQTGHSLIVEDTAVKPECGSLPEGYRAYLGVPLRPPHGNVIGTICAFHKVPRRFAVEELRLAEVFAERAATAIDNYQIYQQQQQINAQLQAEIHDRLEAEKALRESEAKFRQLAENIDQVFWMHAPDGTPLYLSPAFETIWGQPRQNWFTDPNTWANAIHPDDRERIIAAHTHCGDRKMDEEYRVLRPDGSVRIIRDQAFPIRDETGTIYRVAGIAEDITDAKQAQQEMLKATAALAEVGELAAMIVHELRNPLTTVLMGLTSFQRLDLPGPHQERLALALEEAERVHNLLQEILLYAKPQALQQTRLELNQLIQDLLEPIRMMPAAMSRAIEFRPAAEPIHVLGDRDKLKQVFINLIANACEAIAEGAVVTWTLDLDPIAACVYMRIHNGGEPIPPETLSKLTKPFYTTKPSGTGLGLAIVKRIVDAHGGELAIASSAETGTVVGVKLPLTTN